MKETEQRIPINEKFRTELGKILKEYRIKSQQISEYIMMNRTYVSHITLGKIKHLPSSTIDSLIRAISERAAENRPSEEPKTIRKKISFTLKEALPGSYTNLIHEIHLSKRLPFYNKEFLKWVKEELATMNYSPSEFINKVVNPKGGLEILNYRKELVFFEYNYDSDYFDNMLLEPTDKQHFQPTTYNEIFLLVYRFFELLECNSRETFEEMINDICPAFKNTDDLSNEMLLKEAAYATLFQVEYYTFDEFREKIEKDPESQQFAEGYSLMAESIPNEERTEMQIYAKIGSNLQTLSSYFMNPDFIERVYKNLEHPSPFFIYSILNLDYTKITNDDSRRGFWQDVERAYKKWADK